MKPMTTTHKTAKHTIRFMHDAKDAKFFKKHRFSLVTSTRGFRVLIHLKGGPLGAARMLLKQPTSVKVQLITPPKPLGRVIVVDMSRANLRIQKSTLDMMKTCPNAPHDHWIPSEADAPVRSPERFDALFARYRAGDAGALDEILWATGPLLRGFVDKSRRLNMPDLESKLHLGLLRAAMIWLPGKSYWINYARRQLNLVIKGTWAVLVPTVPLDQSGQVEVADDKPSQYHEELVVQPPELLTDDSAILSRYINRLTKTERVDVKMFFEGGSSKQEIATEAGFSREAARCAVNRAVRKLRDMMDSDGVTLETFRGS